MFGYNFYSWRGRAFILAVQAARQCRQTRIALASPTGADSTQTASVAGVDATPTTTFATAPFSEATPLRQDGSFSSEAPPRDQDGNKPKSTVRTKDITRVPSSGGTAIQSFPDTHMYGSTAGTMAPEDDSGVRRHADDVSDEENVDQSTTGVPQKPRRSRHSRKQRKWGIGHSGSAYRDVVLAGDDSDSGEAPGKSEKAGWRSRVSKWYRDK